MRQEWATMTREELRAAFPQALAVLPTAATEQHGPHLATGHDTASVAAIAAAAADRTPAPVVIAPALAFGSSHHHLPFGGTLSLATGTYRRVVHDLVASMLAGGARRILLLNGHGGNQEINQLVVRDLALDPATPPDARLAAASYWQIAEAALAAEPALAGMRVPGHAGWFETAAMLALAPAQVREPRPVRATDPANTAIVPGTRLEAPGAWQGFDGYTDFPHRATRAEGERILDIVIREVAAAYTALAP